jgi:predicted  nucleic acid-binding Zn-ribbon protein
LQQLQEDIMTANSANPEADSHMDDLAAKTIDLQHRLADGARKLEALSAQQANSTSLIRQLQSDVEAALAQCQQLNEEVQRRAEEDKRRAEEEASGVVATLQAAVEKTRDRVLGGVGHVREQAVAALHRIKGDESRSDRQQSSSLKE